MDILDELFDHLEGNTNEPKMRQAVIFLDDVDKIKKQTVYQVWNQIVDCFDNLEKTNKKSKYTAEDVRKKVKAICIRSITSQNKII